jgi:hypothetical protein
MKGIAVSVAASTQDTGSFRKLVEQKITIDEYVSDLDKRSSELRDEPAPERKQPEPS